MARTERAQQEVVVKDSALDTGGPALRDGHDQIVEEAPGVGPAAEMISPVGGPVLFDGVDGEAFEGIDPLAFDGVDGEPFGGSDPLAFDGVDGEPFGGSAAGLPDLGVGDDRGAGLGSTLLDDLAGGSDLPDPTGGVDGMSDSWSAPVINDQSGWAMDLPSGLGGDTAGQNGGNHADDGEPESQNVWGGEDEDAEEYSQILDDGHLPTLGSQTMPAPDDGTGGDPDDGDFIGGRGDVDPPPETENHGGGDLIGGRGDVDPDPDLDDAGGGGTIDLERLGVGVIDPLDGESTLLGGDTGDLAEMAAEADLGDVEIEFDDSLADADIGDDA